MLTGDRIGMNRKGLVNDEFAQAIRDYYLLLQRRYPQKALLKIIGDRFRLDSTQRTVLFRGVVPGDKARMRRRRLHSSCRNRRLYLDGYNVLYTICNYLAGRTLFISNDGFLRDAGEIHAKSPSKEKMDEAITVLLRFLNEHPPTYVKVILDAPVSFSGELSARLAELLNTNSLPGDAVTARSADFPLRSVEYGLVASSDSAIIDSLLERKHCALFDFAYHALKKYFDPSFIRLRAFTR